MVGVGQSRGCSHNHWQRAVSRALFWGALRWLNLLAYGLGHCRWKPLARLLIWIHMRIYDVKLQEAVIEQPGEFATFNDFFTRRLKPKARPVAQQPGAVVSPCDGTIIQNGEIENGLLVQAKGHHYSVDELLIGRTKSTDEPRFKPSRFITIYLGPADYHGVHTPANLVITKTRYIPGRLLPVRPDVVAHVPKLFSNNQRLVIYGRADFGELVLVMVGALLVSGVCTEWHPNPYHKASEDSLEPPLTLKSGERVGHFNFGSTVILLLPEKVALLPTLAQGAEVRYGELLGTID